MSTSFLEIVELPSGEIVLRRSDEENAEPLLKMTFSEEILDYLQGDYFDVAKAMIDACIHEVSRKTDDEAHEKEPHENEESNGNRVLH